MPDFITLSCPSCEAKLEVTPDIDRFACAHCGTEHIVKRAGGIVSLLPVVEAIKGVQTGVDKTAAELGIARLQKEIEELTASTNKFIKENPQPFFGSLFILLIFFGFLIALVSFASSSWKINAGFIVGLIMFFLGILPLFFLRGNKKKWQETKGVEIKMMQDQIEAKKAELAHLQEIVKV